MPVTRQLRIYGDSNIQKRIGDFIGKAVTFVLKDTRVVTGILETKTAEAATLRNMRLKKVEIPISQISEMYFDTVAEC